MSRPNAPSRQDQPDDTSPAVVLNGQYDISDLHSSDEKIVAEVFRLYHAKLHSRITPWMRERATIDAEGLASEAILEALASCGDCKNFDDLDRKINTAFDWLEHEAAIGAWATHHSFAKTKSLDTPLPGHDKVRSSYDVIQDKKVLTPLDLMILAEENFDEKKTRKQEIKDKEREKKKQLAISAAQAVLTPVQMEMFELWYQQGASFDDVANAAKVERHKVPLVLRQIKSHVQKRIENPEWVPRRVTRFNRRTDKERLAINPLLCRAYGFGIDKEKIMLRFDMSEGTMHNFILASGHAEEIRRKRQEAKARRDAALGKIVCRAYGFGVAQFKIMARYHVSTAKVADFINNSGEKEKLYSLRLAAFDRKRGVLLDMHKPVSKKIKVERPPHKTIQEERQNKEPDVLIPVLLRRLADRDGFSSYADIMAASEKILSQKDLNIFQLRCKNGLNTTAIAKKLELPKINVKGRLYAAKLHLEHHAEDPSWTGPKTLITRSAEQIAHDNPLICDDYRNKLAINDILEKYGISKENLRWILRNRPDYAELKRARKNTPGIQPEQRLNAATTVLNSEDLQIFNMRHEQNMKMDQICASYDMTKKQLSDKLHRIEIKIQNYIENPQPQKPLRYRPAGQRAKDDPLICAAYRSGTEKQDILDAFHINANQLKKIVNKSPDCEAVIQERRHAIQQRAQIVL